MSYTDIANSPYLTQEDKIRAINKLGEAERFAIDEENKQAKNRILRGSALQVASGLPILNVPYIGTGLGGAMYEAGNAIMQGKPQNEVLKDTARGFAIGESVGAIPYIGKFVGKTKTGQAIGEKANNLFKNLKNTDIGRKIGKKASNVYDYLMTDIKAFNPNKQISYHGSPFDFNKFSNEAIGMGEGAQVHGLGHYTALNKDIADKRYRERLSGSDYDYFYEGKPVFTGEEVISGIYNNGLDDILKTYENSVKKYQKWFDDRGLNPDNINPDDFGYYYEAIEEMRDGLRNSRAALDTARKINPSKIELKKKGQLYKLSIPKDDVMLREDELLSAQPNMANLWDEIRIDRLNKSTKSLPKFKMTLAANDIDISKVFNTNYFNKALEMVKNTPEKYKDLFFSEMDGKGLYNYLATTLGGNNAANKYLQNKGIKGISYNGGIDGEARVIFNPDDIDIVRKYYNQPEAIEYFKKLPNYGAVVNSFDNVPIDKKYWKQYAKDNLVGKSVDIPNYTTVSFTRNNLGKDYSYNMSEYPTLFDQLKGSNYAFSTNYKNEKDRIYNHFVNTNDNRLFDYLIEVIKDNEGDYHHNYKMMKNISRGDKP